MKEFKEFAKVLATESSKVIKKYFRTNVKVETKTDSSPVTIADKKTEEIMRKLINKNFPEHGIMGEEFGTENINAQYKWVLDPIDGTKSFICGALSFGTLIALLKNDKPILGVINHPILDEFLIGDNDSAFINGIKTSIRACNTLTEARLLTTDYLNIEKYQNLAGFNKLTKKVNLYRQWGDCYGYYLLATGYADIMVDPIMSPWDSLALIPIIKGANGTITDYKGNSPVKGNSIIASSKNIHNEIITILNSNK